MHAGFLFSKQSLIFLTIITAFAVSGNLTFAAFPAPPAETGSWQELTGTKLRAVLAPAPAGAPSGSWWNPIYIMDYSGGAFDTKRNRLIVWGGGHADYPGNEIYAIELLPTLKAIRLTDPSLYTLNTTDALADGTPAARHTYASLVYLPEQDALWANGGSLWRSGQGTDGTWMFRFATGKWEKKADHPGGAIADYDPVTKQVVIWGKTVLSTYDPALNTWTIRGSGSGTWSERTGKIVGRKFYIVGWTRGDPTAQYFPPAGTIRIINLDTWAVNTVLTTGAVEMTTTVAPGLDLDPETGELVAWAGGANIYRLNLDTLVWRKETPGGMTPGSAPWEGTYGRFRYVPALQSFVGVSSIDQNAFRYNSTGVIQDQPANDTISPSVSITSLLSGSIVSGGISISASASDNIGVAGVQFYLDQDELGAEDIYAPYSILWDTKTAGNGLHILRAIARDATGNNATSDQVVVTVNNIVVADTTPPKISNISVTITHSSATVTWLTDEPATSRVEYGPTRDYGSTQIASGNPTQLQRIFLTGLTSGTRYFYSVWSADATGNIAVSGNLTFTTSPVPSPNASLIQERTWVALALPPRPSNDDTVPGSGISDYDKHLNIAVNPDNGLVYLMGGDYRGVSFRQETWSLDITERLQNRSNPAAGWKLEYPYCGPAGKPQPKAPDYDGWVWDDTRKVFWFVPGAQRPHGSTYTLCLGETPDGYSTDNGTAQGGPVLVWSEIMTFDPVTKTWQSYDTCCPENIGNIGMWHVAYDAKKDQIIRAATGNGMGIYDIKTKTWRRKELEKNAVGSSVNIFRVHWAPDWKARRIYMNDPWSGRLHAWLIDEERLIDLGMVPGGAITYNQTTTITDKAYVLFDPDNRVLLFYQYKRKGIWLYRVDEPSPAWEQVTWPFEAGSPITAPHCNAWTYHPALKTIVCFGDEKYFLVARTGTLDLPVDAQLPTVSGPGDINDDKTVNILDVVLIANYFGKTTFDSRADAAPPFGIIDIFDVMIVVINWGKQY